MDLELVWKMRRDRFRFFWEAMVSRLRISRLWKPQELEQTRSIRPTSRNRISQGSAATTEIISGSPGKTRTINFFDVTAKIKSLDKNSEGSDPDESQDKTPKSNDVRFRIVDLPGYGYAKVSKKMTDDWGPMMETFLANRKNLRVVVQLVDIRIEPTAQDRQMYDYLRHYGMSGVVVATKADKIKRSQLGKSMAVIRKALDLTDEDIIIPVSALKREGQDRLLDVMEQIVTAEQE